MKGNALVGEFVELVKIPSPSGKERKVAEHIKKRLGSMGVKSYFDNAGSKVDSDCGNLIAKIGNGPPVAMFVAHMDTVEDGKRKITPIVKNGVIRSDGTTVLGSDDKAAIAALLEAIKALRGERRLPGVLFVFTLREEKGLMGVNHLSIPRSVKFAFDADGSEPPGGFIHRARGNQTFEIVIRGKAAHAAKDPERGRNAIKAAGLIISRLELGKVSSGRISNIGTISGGTRPNVIPDLVTMSGETRAYNLEGIRKSIEKIRAVAASACRSTGCSYRLVLKALDLPLNTATSERIVKLAEAATEKAGLRFHLIAIPATIQGCAIAAKGVPTLGLAKGGTLPHSFSESIKVEELSKTRDIIIEIVKSLNRFT